MVVLKEQLKSFDNCSSITYCKQLVRSLLNSLEQSFGDLFLDRKLRLASMVHPMFKLTRLKNPEDHANAVQLLKAEVAKMTCDEETDFNSQVKLYSTNLTSVVTVIYLFISFHFSQHL